MLTFLLMVDLQSAFNDSTDPVLQTMAVNWTDIFEKSTYAGMSSLTLFVPFRFDDCTIAVAYVPILDTATYMIGDATTDFEIEYVLSKSCGGDYYENTSDALLEVMSDFQSDD